MDWNDRWKEADRFEASWRKGRVARLLELQAIAEWRRGKKQPLRVLEVGCGAFTLDEDGRYPLYKADPYTGLDSSAVAIASCRGWYPGYRFEVVDLLDPAPWPEADAVICRRVLQNLPCKHGPVLARILAYRHGIVLETTWRGMDGTFPVVPRYTIPDHVHPLFADEVLSLDRRAAPRRPLSRMYYQRLVLGQEPDGLPGDAAFGPHEVWAW